MLRNQAGIVLRFAADDWRSEIGPKESSQRTDIGRAVVDPHFQRWELIADLAERPEIVPVVLDRVEIGDIKGREGEDRQETANHIERVAGWRQRRYKWAIGPSVALARVDNLTAHEVNDRDNLQRGLRGVMIEGGSPSPLGAAGSNREIWPALALPPQLKVELSKK